MEGGEKLNINERIKQFRKDKKLNQQQIASLLGFTQSGVSYMEQSGSTVSESSIKSLCLAFNLNENWLRDGTEPMYIQPAAFSLDDFVKSKGATTLELEIVKAYFELDGNIRKAAINHFKERLAAAMFEDDVPDTPEELEENFPPIEFGEQNEVG